MIDLLQKIDYGSNVECLMESEECQVMRLRDDSGEGRMTLYRVFPSVVLMYNDFHMSTCVSEFQTAEDLLCTAGKGVLNRKLVKMFSAIWALVTFGWIGASIILARWRFLSATIMAFPSVFR